MATLAQAGRVSSAAGASSSLFGGTRPAWRMLRSRGLGLGLLTLLVVGGLAEPALLGPTDEELAVLRRCYPIILRAQRADHYFFDHAAATPDEPRPPPLELLYLEPSLSTPAFEKLGFEVRGGGLLQSTTKLTLFVLVQSTRTRFCV